MADECTGLGIGSSDRAGFVEELNKQIDVLVDCAAHVGGPEGAVRSSVQDLCSYFKKQQSDSVVGGTNVYPLLIATDGEIEGEGTSFLFYKRDGSAQRIPGATGDYHFYKCLSQTAFGVYSIISPYFKSPQSTNWVESVEQVLTKIKNGLAALQEAPKEFNKEKGAHALNVLKVTQEYLESIVAAKEVKREEYHKFGRDIYSHFEKGAKEALKDQVSTSIPALKKLREELGEDEWAELYVVIPTKWDSAAANPRKEILEYVLNKDRIDSHVIIGENIKTIAEARELVGRVLVRRAFGQIFFGIETEERKEWTFNSSTRRDLYIDLTKEAIKYWEAIKVEVEVKTTTIFEVGDDDEDEDEPEPTVPKRPPPKKEDELGKYTQKIVEV